MLCECKFKTVASTAASIWLCFSEELELRVGKAVAQACISRGLFFFFFSF
jgi:hypothetical protein